MSNLNAWIAKHVMGWYALPSVLALLVLASDASASTIYGNQTEVDFGLFERDVPGMRAGGRLPFLFEAIGSIDTESLLFTLESFRAQAPSVDVTFTTVVPPQPQFYDPPGFEPPYEIDPIPSWSYTGTWTWEPLPLTPISMTAQLDPASLIAILSFDRIALGRLHLDAEAEGRSYSLEGPTFYARPWVRVECAQGSGAECRSFVSLGDEIPDGYLFDFAVPTKGTVALGVGFGPVQGSVPEPGLGLLIALTWAVRRVRGLSAG